ncbi:hypothetical protein [Microbacterium sp.]|uniref:hypothetical protein n=1 Tax=Microbacterium sp. TaxID=51671 RepID=UPI003A8C40FF
MRPTRVSRVWRTDPDVNGPKPEGRVRGIIEVLLGTALRVGECLALPVRDGDGAGHGTRASTLEDPRGVHFLRARPHLSKENHMSRKLSTPALLGAITLALVGLTGCGSATTGQEAPEGAPANSTQSVDEACRIANAEMRAIMREFSGSVAQMNAAVQSGDTSGVEELIESFSEKVDTVSAQVTNPEVADAFGGFSTAWYNFADTYDELLTVVADQDLDALLKVNGEIADATDALNDAGTAMGEYCN